MGESRTTPSDPQAQGKASESYTRLRWIEVRSFKKAAATRLEFDEGVNLLLGKNGTGKTNLLHLISMVLRFDFQEIATQQFDIEFFVGRHDPNDCDVAVEVKSTIEHSQPIAGREPSGVGAADGGIPSDPRPAPVVRTKITLTYSAGRILTWHDGPDGCALFESTTGKKHELGPGPSIAFQQNWFGRFAQLFQVGALTRVPVFLVHSFSGPYRFDESLQTFEAMHGGEGRLWRGELSTPPPASLEVTRYGNKKHPVSYRPVYVPSVDVSSVFRRGEGALAVDVPFLVPAAQVLGFKRITWRPLLQASTSDEGATRDLYTRFEFSLTTVREDFLSASLLSYGQKRLLAFFYYLDASPTWAIADELVNGFHHEWIRASLSALGGRQTFLTSQNPLLLDFVAIPSSERARRMFIRCSVSESGQWTWSNLASSEAEEFVSELDSCIDQTSSVLLRKGLW